MQKYNLLNQKLKFFAIETFALAGDRRRSVQEQRKQTISEPVGPSFRLLRKYTSPSTKDRRKALV